MRVKTVKERNAANLLAFMSTYKILIKSIDVVRGREGQQPLQDV